MEAKKEKFLKAKINKKVNISQAGFAVALLTVDVEMFSDERAGVGPALGLEAGTTLPPFWDRTK